MGRMALGKQVGTYLNGELATGFDTLQTKLGWSTYRLLMEAVRRMLLEEGVIEDKKQSKFNMAPGPNRDESIEDYQARMEEWKAEQAEAVNPRISARRQARARRSR